MILVLSKVCLTTPFKISSSLVTGWFILAATENLISFESYTVLFSGKAMSTSSLVNGVGEGTGVGVGLGVGVGDGGLPISSKSSDSMMSPNPGPSFGVGVGVGVGTWLTSSFLESLELDFGNNLNAMMEEVVIIRKMSPNAGIKYQRFWCIRRKVFIFVRSFFI